MKTADKPAPVLPAQIFENTQDWHAWLDENHAASRGVWLRLAKKGSATPTVSYAEALEVALCYGWIDGQKQAHGAEFWLQKFTPRSAKSVWSQINKEKALALAEAGKMKPAGLREIEAAKRDGRWEAAYHSASRASVPDDLQAALDANPRAKAFFGTLDSRNRYGILYRVQTAKKAETRSKRITQFVEMLARRETLY
ncbi:MAG TPA: YdeI/OmpD-associated family protein [Gallionellaceae bacterium]|nr:YdeI/OmpD-associated family protein [Gallionellaceae bacterium]